MNNVNDYSILRQADRNRIVSALSRLNINRNGKWLSDSNAYSTQAQDAIRNDSKMIPSSKEADFAEYLAASSFVHCGDAWSYLGRALDSLLRGDVHSAVHLTYYSELRAAISLLTTEGIYVGDYFSCALDINGRAQPFSREGTHRSVWKSLQEWGQSPRSSAFMGTILRPGNVELQSWIANIPSGTTLPIISELLNRMKFDLQSFEDDRTRRNAASYTPSRLVTNNICTSDIRRIVSNIWAGLEPGTRGTFPVLDQFLLHDILISTFSAANLVQNDDDTTDEVDWSRWEAWLEDLLPTQLTDSSIVDLLSGRARGISETSFLTKAFEDDRQGSEPHEYIEGMLTRTSILLRFATGSCLDLLRASTLDDDEVRPWAESLSLDRGLWDPSEPPEDKLDLWMDTYDALGALEGDSSSDLHGLVHGVRDHLPTLGQAERVIAWNFS